MTATEKLAALLAESGASLPGPTPPSTDGPTARWLAVQSLEMEGAPASV